MKYLLAASTDKGKRKNVNQDSMLLLKEKEKSGECVLAVVCDGMGGYESGELASLYVTEIFSRWFYTELPQLNKNEEEEVYEDLLYEAWEKLLQTAHSRLRAYGKQRGIKIGTTMTAMLLHGKNYYIAHVGDSRAYEIKDEAVLLTRDQTYCGIIQNSMKESGKTADGVRPISKSVLLQGVGASRTLRPVYNSGGIKEKAVYLLCSDGLMHKINDKTLCRELSAEAPDTEDALLARAENIIKIARDSGERDDITLLLIGTVT